MKLNTNKVYKILEINPLRIYAAITNMTDSIIYLRNVEGLHEDIEQNGFPLAEYGVIEMQGLDCYKGELYAITDTDNNDVRVLEL